MARRHLVVRVTAAVCGVVLLVSGLQAIPWPVNPGGPVHYIGNTYGEYQRYGGSPYLHPGLDVLVPAGTPIYAVRSGWVKAVLTISADLHWRVAIGDLPGTEECEGWLYAHIDQSTITVAEGDYVEEGDYLGEIVYWPTADFHHIHFVKIRHAGQPWQSDWDFIANPLDELEGILDLDDPEISSCYAQSLLAFLENGTHNYFAPGDTLSGDVDIIARVSDRINHSSWDMSPYTIAYEIRNDTSTTGLIHALTFTGQLFYDQNVHVIFQDDAEFDTRGDYNVRDFYHIITNTDRDSVIEVTDTAGCWRTTDFDDGDYWIKVFVADRDGFDGTNYDTVDSMLVTVRNTPLCNCTGFCDVDGNDVLDPVDVSYLVNYVYKGLDARVLLPDCPQENGDWDCSGNIDPLDVAFYVNYVYKGFGTGPCDPCA